MTNHKQLIDDLAAIAVAVRDQYIEGLREDGEPLTFNERQKLLTQYLAIIDRVAAYEKQNPDKANQPKQMSMIPFAAFYPEA